MYAIGTQETIERKPLRNPSVHPLRLPERAATSPYTGEANSKVRGLVPLRNALSCWRGQPRRGRVWRGPSSFYRTARKYVTPHIRLGLRQATFSPGRRLWIVRTFGTYRPSSGRNNDSGHLPPGEGIRHTSTSSDRTPPQSAFAGRQLPLHRGAIHPAASAYGIPAGGACRRPYTQKRSCVPPLHPLFSLPFSLFSY